MAKDEQPGQGVSPGVEILRQLPAYLMGRDHGFLIYMNRRCSVPSQDIVKWREADLEAFKLGVEESGK